MKKKALSESKKSQSQKTARLRLKRRRQPLESVSLRYKLFVLDAELWAATFMAEQRRQWFDKDDIR